MTNPIKIHLKTLDMDIFGYVLEDGVEAISAVPFVSKVGKLNHGTSRKIADGYEVNSFLRTVNRPCKQQEIVEIPVIPLTDLKVVKPLKDRIERLKIFHLQRKRCPLVAYQVDADIIERALIEAASEMKRRRV